MMIKGQPNIAKDIQEAEVVETKYGIDKKTRLKKGDYILFFVWLLGVFLIVISARLTAMPSDEFPALMTILIVLLTLYVVGVGYGASLSPDSTRALFPNLFACAVIYLLPALIAITIVNAAVPKTTIAKREADAIELRYDGYDISFWLDADITYERPFVFLFPFDTIEAYIGNVYYDDEAYSISECVDNNSGDFYAGKIIRCVTNDGTYGRMMLHLDKLSYKIAK